MPMIQPVLDEPESLVVLELLVAVGVVVVTVPAPVAPDPWLVPFPLVADPLPVEPVPVEPVPVDPAPPDPVLVEPLPVVPVPFVAPVGGVVVVPGGVVVVASVPFPGFDSGFESTGHVPNCSRRDSVVGGGSVWTTGGIVADRLGWGSSAVAAVAITPRPAAVAAAQARPSPIRTRRVMATSGSFLPPGPRRRPGGASASRELVGRTLAKRPEGPAPRNYHYGDR